MKKKLKCFVCHKEVNEEDDYVFKGQTVHKGECLKSMIDEYNAVRNLQIRNKRLCAEIERLNNIINELEHDFESYELEYLQDTYQGSLADFIETELERIKELKGSGKEWN